MVIPGPFLEKVISSASEPELKEDEWGKPYYEYSEFDEIIREIETSLASDVPTTSLGSYRESALKIRKINLEEALDN